MTDYKMRRSNRQMSDTDAKEVLHNGEYGVLSTIDSDGCPYGVPLNFAFDGERIYFHCAKDVGRILRTFKIKKNVEVTDNGKIII